MWFEVDLKDLKLIPVNQEKWPDSMATQKCRMK